MKGIEIKGNWIGLVTALLMAGSVAWQAYAEYQKAHPQPPQQTQLQPPSPSVTPVYWNDGQRWWCQIGDKRYVWNDTVRR